MTSPDNNASPPSIDVGGAARVGRRRLSERMRAVVAALGSMFVHAAAIVALGLSLANPTGLEQGRGLESFVAASVDPLRKEPPPEQPLDRPPEPRIEPAKPSAAAAARAATVAAKIAPSVPPPKLAQATTKTAPIAATQLEADLYARAPLLTGLETGKYKVELGAARSQGQRLQAVLYRGGSAESEKAVERALAWLLKHQDPDGGWSFDHRTCGDCNGRCGNPGTLASGRIAATSMALLPFLAAGETHKQGKHRREVEKGLKFLVHNIQTTPQGGVLTAGGGSMYAHSLATIVLCEALAMTRDRDLAGPAKAATTYILNAQDARGGGWRYFPGQPGDVSVTGWAFNALKSADNAYQPVPPPSIDKVRAFLDSMQSDEGAAYGYDRPEQGTPSTTAVGLLCRMQLGWKRDEPALLRGVSELTARGPLPNNIYYNFYATQVLHHFGGPSWEQWNKQMRDHLVRSQSTTGHEAGSWYFQETTPEDQLPAAVGGRLYCTSLAALTLEVYYRHLPLYGNRIFNEELKHDPESKRPAGLPLPIPSGTPIPSAIPTVSAKPAATAKPNAAGSARSAKP